MDYKSEDVIDIKKISQLLESYTKATGLVSALVDLDGNILAQSGWQNICTQFHRKNPETAKNCHKSDTILAGKLQDGNKYNIYECLNGLIDVAVPIIVNDKHIYNLFTGQFLMEAPNKDLFIAQADKYNFDKKEYMDALSQVPIFKESEIKDRLLFLSQMTEVIVELGLAKFERIKTNIALKESEEKFKSLMQQSPFIVELYDIDGLQISVNKAYEELWTFPAETTVNKFNVLKSKEVEDSGLIKYIKQAYAGEYVNVPEYKFDSTGNTEAKGKGRVRWLNTSIYPIKSELKKVTNIVIVHQDVTDRKQSEEELKESIIREGILANIVRESSVGIAIGYPDGRLGLCNSAFQNITGYNEEELKTIDWNAVLTPPEWEESESAKLQELHRTKKPIKYEKEYIRKDGSRVPVELIVNPQFNGDNIVEYYFAFIIDITERKITEEALRINEEKLSIIINSSPVGICTVDMLGNFITTNQAYERILGYTKEELIDLSFFDVTHSNDRPKNKKLFQDMFSLETPDFSIEKRYIRKDGVEIMVSLHAVGIRDAEGNIKYGTAFVEDITERKLAEQAISLSNKRYKSLFNDSPIPLWEEDLTEVSSYLLDVKEKGHKELRIYFENNPDELIKCSRMVKILDVNQAALDLHKATNKEQLIGNIDRIFTANSFTIFLEEIISLFEGNKLFEGESEVKTLSGDLKDIYLTLKIDQSQPDRVIALLATSDITKRKQAEKSLKNTFDISPSIISKANIDNGYFVEVNQAVNKILGYSVEEFMSIPFMELIHPDDKHEAVNEISEQLTGKEVIFFENRYLCKNGSYKWMAWHGTKADDNGIVTAIGSDIHERKMAEQELTKHRENLEDLVKERTKELETKNKELERFNDLFVDREFRIKELKDEISELKTGK
jgi:PAS domain S-box-containing protein